MLLRITGVMVLIIFFCPNLLRNHFYTVNYMHVSVQFDEFWQWQMPTKPPQSPNSEHVLIQKFRTSSRFKFTSPSIPSLRQLQDCFLSQWNGLHLYKWNHTYIWLLSRRIMPLRFIRFVAWLCGTFLCLLRTIPLHGSHCCRLNCSPVHGYLLFLQFLAIVNEAAIFTYKLLCGQMIS